MLGWAPRGDSFETHPATGVAGHLLFPIEAVAHSFLPGSTRPTWAYLAHYTTADKTGTAQISNPAGGGYYTDRVLHSFFGYFPAYKPQFIIFLFSVYPKGAEYASATLTTPFIDLTKFLINYYEVALDR